MPVQLEVLRQKRDRVLQDMQTIDRLRRGTLSQQFFKPFPGQTEKRGPYFILQGYFQGKKFSERVSAEQAPRVQRRRSITISASKASPRNLSS